MIGEYGQYKEAYAAAGITPGHLIELTSANKVRKHSTEGGVAEAYFAIENALVGKTIDDAYITNDVVMGYLAAKGDVVNAYIQAGQNIAIGDKLISAADGTLQELGTEATGTVVRTVVGVAMEAANLTDTGAVATRILVRIV